MSYNRKNRELIEENKNLLHQVDFLQRCFNVQKEKRMNKQAQDESDLKSYELYMYYYDDKTGKFSSLPPFVMEVKGKDIRDAAAKFAVHCADNELCEKKDKDGNVCHGCICFEKLYRE
jgi:hypothetical protein